MANYSITERGVLEDLTGEDDDMTQPRTDVYIVRTENDEDLTEGDDTQIRRDFRAQCYCAHDCCGHRNGGVSSITKIWPGKYVVLVLTQLNY